MTATKVPITAEIPAYRAFHVEVARTIRLSPSFRRITFTGKDLCRFANNGFDQRIKLVLPLRDQGYSSFDDGPDWHRQWRAQPPELRNPLRTFTVRAVRPALAELDVDFVMHGTGPASRWASSATPGERAVVIGPNAMHPGPTNGLEWAPPRRAGRLLLAGDETAVPAVSAIAETLPGGVPTSIFLEVPEIGDMRPLRTAPGVEITWLPRRESAPNHRGCGAARHGDLLVSAVRAAVEDLAPAADIRDLEDIGADTAVLWDVPQEPARSDGFYAWLAGEAGMVRRLRRLLVGEVGIDRASVAFMGYWRMGRAESG